MTDKSERPRPLPETLVPVAAAAAATTDGGDHARERSRMYRRERSHLRARIQAECLHFCDGIPEETRATNFLSLFNMVWERGFKRKRSSLITTPNYSSRVIRQVYAEIQRSREREPPPAPPASPVVVASRPPAPIIRPTAVTIRVSVPEEEAYRMPDATTVENIEMLFVNAGIGESGAVCPICLEPKRIHLEFSSACKHSSCMCCYAMHLGISMESRKFPLECPGCKASGSKTPELIDPELVVHYMRTSQLAEKYRDMVMRFNKLQLLNMKTEDSKLAPKACYNCGFIGFCMPGFDRAARCCNPACAMRYCASCGNRMHPGKTCEEWARGIVEMEKPEETKKYIITTSKPCPKCRTGISHFRNHGCHHMTCSCGHQFCWICLQPWSNAHKPCPMFCNNSCGCVPCDSCSPGKRCPACSGCSKCAPILVL